MKKILRAIICALVCSSAWAAVPGDWLKWKPGQPLEVVAPEAEPFWKRKEKIYQRVKSERMVAVKVTAIADESKGKDFRRMKMLGAGHSHVPTRFAFDQACAFDKLPKMSSYIRHVSHHKEIGQVAMHSQAFGYKAFMRMQVDPQWQGEKGRIGVRVIEGTFEGMTATLLLEPLDPTHTEISLTAQYDYEKLPIPAFFVEFGLEVVVQKVAERMRAFAEQEYQDLKIGEQKQEKPK